MITRTTVITLNQIEGFHAWPAAPETVNYLRDRHRHMFTIECEFAVSHDDRDIEIITQQHAVENLIRDRHGIPALFGSMSCEAIAREIVQFFPECTACTVREDGMGGARVERAFTGKGGSHAW